MSEFAAAIRERNEQLAQRQAEMEDERKAEYQRQAMQVKQRMIRMNNDFLELFGASDATLARAVEESTTTVEEANSDELVTVAVEMRMAWRFKPLEPKYINEWSVPYASLWSHYKSSWGQEPVGGLTMLHELRSGKRVDLFRPGTGEWLNCPELFLF